MAPTKKLLFFGLIILASFLFFSFSGNAQAQTCSGAGGYCAGYCPDGALSSAYDCDALGGEDCCADPLGSSGGGANTCDDLGACNFGSVGACDYSCLNTTSTCDDINSCNFGASAACDYSCFNTSGGTTGTGVETCGVFTPGTCVPTSTTCSDPIIVGLCNTSGTFCCANGAFGTGGAGGTGSCAGCPSMGCVVAQSPCTTSTGTQGVCTDVQVCTATGGFPTSGTGSGIQIPSGGSTLLPSSFGLPDPQGGIPQILLNLLKWLVTIFGVLAMISFFVSGIQYIMAAGNEATIETAKRNITYSIIGVIFGLSGYIIIRAIQVALTANSLF